MTGSDPRTKQHVDRDGVRTIERPGVRTSVWLLTLALALVGLAVFVFIRPVLHRMAAAPTELSFSERAADVPAPRVAAAPPQAPPGAAPAAGDVSAPRENRSSAEPQQPPAPPHSAVPAGAAPAASTAPDADDAAREPTGIGLFPPPGTKPIKQGIVVPDDVELPPGYVRHYQTMDDGHQLPPILMFHPDYHPLDARGEPIPLPEDRVVPQDMAPAGIPVEILTVPEEGAPVAEAPGRRRNEPDR